MPFRDKGGNNYMWLEKPRRTVISLFSCSLTSYELTDQLDKMVSKGQQQPQLAMILRNTLEDHRLFRPKCGKTLVRMGGE